MNKLQNILIKEALALLRLGFGIEEIIELDKELSSQKKVVAKPTAKPSKSGSVKRKKTKTASKKEKADDATDEGIKDALISILNEVREVGKNPINI